MNVTTKTSEYYGKPCLEFRNGSGKPFSLGAYKLRMILTALPDVRDWLIEQGETIPAMAINPVPFEAAPATYSALAKRVTSLEATPVLGERVKSLELTLAVIWEEITRAATPMDNDAGHRQMQLD